MNEYSLMVTDEFKERIRVFKDDYYQKYNKISKTETPQVDGDGKRIIKDRPDGKKYIDDAWMTDRLDKHFPGWSWEAAAPLHFLGAEWVVAQGHLLIIDEHLIPLGINPPIRKYYGVDAVRIQYKKDLPHTPENIIDVGDNCQSAVTGAKKRAINRLTHIGDDIYGKRMEEEGAGSFEEVVMASGDGTMFGQWLKERGLGYNEVFKILKVSSLTEVTDFAKAMEDIKKAKGWS